MMSVILLLTGIVFIILGVINEGLFGLGIGWGIIITLVGLKLEKQMMGGDRKWNKKWD